MATVKMKIQDIDEIRRYATQHFKDAFGSFLIETEDGIGANDKSCSWLTKDEWTYIMRYTLDEEKVLHVTNVMKVRMENLI